jgi:hypothetical protein
MPQVKSPDLHVNQPISAAPPDMILTIEVDPAKPLRIGTYVFRLQVADESGNNSPPVQVKLNVIDESLPTAVITAPERASFGKTFVLSSEKSFDTGGGKISKFVWTLISAP